MRSALGRDWRNLGRSEGSRLHRYTAVGHGVGTKRNAVLARAPGGSAEFERRADAVANRERAIAVQRSRPSGPGDSGVGSRAVPGARNAAGPMELRA